MSRLEAEDFRDDGGAMRIDERGESVGVWQAGKRSRKPPTSPELMLHGSFGGRRPGDEPLHDWQRSALDSSSPGTTNAGMAPERVGRARIGLVLPAAVAESLQMLLWRRASKTKSTAGEFLFPLPLEGYEDVHPEKRMWLKAILLALNSYAGAEGTAPSAPTAMQKQVASTVMGFVDRMWSWEERVPQLSFEELFRVKGVDYRGEEIKLARSFNWECIAAAFPPEVATLNVEDFCTGGCLNYVLEFENFLLPEAQQTVGRPPRTMVHEDDWEEVCRGLIRTGICGILP
eukprot:s855_g15.t1